MSQIQNTAPAPIRLRQGLLQPPQVAAAVMTALAITFLIVIAAMNVRPSTAGSAAAGTADVTDGWMSGSSAITQALSNGRALGVTDGWAGRYLPSARTVSATDGWAGRYLPSAQTVNVTDGWAGRYLPSAQTVNVTDGWAGRYLH